MPAQRLALHSSVDDNIMPKRTKAEAEATREALLDAAEVIFLERGVSRTSLEQIARQKTGDAIRALIGSSPQTASRIADDGSEEEGFVPPPRELRKPPAPPRTASSAETLLACCCCPVSPMSRTEAKKPPQPPVLVTKLRDERQAAASGAKGKRKHRKRN